MARSIAALATASPVGQNLGLVQCGLCGDSPVPDLVRFGHFRIGRCPGCGSGQVLEGPSSSTSYAEDYQAEYNNHKAPQCWQLVEAMELKPGRVLDVGCGDGQFLDIARQAGWETHGLELSPVSSQAALERGHQVSCGSVTEPLDPDPGQFDLITVWDLLEHLAEPGRALSLLSRQLKPGGVLVLVTPMMGSVFDRWGIALRRLSFGLLPQLVKMCWSQEHLFRFDPRGLSGFLQGQNLEPLETRPIQLLSLQADRYAGGKILPTWTGSRTIDGLFSRVGVMTARMLGLHNKVLVVARRSEP